MSQRAETVSEQNSCSFGKVVSLSEISTVSLLASLHTPVLDKMIAWDWEDTPRE